MPDQTSARRRANGQPGRAPRPARRVNQRSDVAEAALSLFARQGYRATGVRDIADTLGIGTTSVYSHIRSKADLLRDIVLQTVDAVLAGQADAIASSDDVAVQLRRVAEAQVRRFVRFPREAIVTTQDFTCLEGPDLAAALERRHDYRQHIEELLERGAAEGRFSVDNAKVTAFAIIEMCEAVPKWFRPEGDLSAERVAYLYGEFAVRLAQGT